MAISALRGPGPATSDRPASSILVATAAGMSIAADWGSRSGAGRSGQCRGRARYVGSEAVAANQNAATATNPSLSSAGAWTPDKNSATRPSMHKKVPMGTYRSAMSALTGRTNGMEAPLPEACLGGAKPDSPLPWRLRPVRPQTTFLRTCACRRALIRTAALRMCCIPSRAFPSIKSRSSRGTARSRGKRPGRHGSTRCRKSCRAATSARISPCAVMTASPERGRAGNHGIRTPVPSMPASVLPDAKRPTACDQAQQIGGPIPQAARFLLLRSTALPATAGP